MIGLIFFYLFVGYIVNLCMATIILPDESLEFYRAKIFIQAIILSPIFPIVLLILIIAKNKINTIFSLAISIYSDEPDSGGLFFVPKHGILGYIISKWQKSKGIPAPFCDYTHTGIITCNGYGIHSVGKGVVEVNIKKTYPKAVFYTHKMLIENKQLALRVLNTAKTFKSKKYDIFSLIGFVFMDKVDIIRRLFNIDPMSTLFCSELAVIVYRKSGIPICEEVEPNPEHISPGLLAMDKDLIKL